MQIDSDAEEETQMRAEGEKSDRAKDNNQVNPFWYPLLIWYLSF